MRLDTLLASLEQPALAMHAGSGAGLDLATTEITSLAYDSRQVQPGGLFLAVPGEHTDGRRFVEDAARRGAVAALGPRYEGDLPASLSLPLPYIEVADIRSALADLACAFYNYPAQQLCTIGVTGTDGKTTTSNLISTILDAAGNGKGLMRKADFYGSRHERENPTRQQKLGALENQEFLCHHVKATVN